jgi:DNA polymerase-3 subunit delta'
MSWVDLIGNKRIKSVLTSYLKNDIIPFSMIFSGPAAADKLGFASTFARSLNCLELEDDYCGRCRHCVEIEKEIFPDLKVLKPEGQFYKKEQITFLIEDNFRRPLKGRRKIYILNDVQRMNENAANAFLKVLEEPAESSLFILLTHNLVGLLPTIKSRCQVLNFTLPSLAETRDFLLEKGFDKEKAELVSHLSQSGLADLMDGRFDEWMEKRSGVQLVLIKLIKKREVEDVLLDLYHRSRSREKFIEYFKELVNLISLMLRDIMILKIDKASDFIMNIDYREVLLELGEYVTIQKLLALIRGMELLYRDIYRNLNTRVLILEFIKNYTIREV